MFATNAISCFFIATTRNANDATNKLREDILHNIRELPSEYFTDIEYGTQWSCVRNGWVSIIETICQVPSPMVGIKRMGGRKYNYDYELSYGTNIRKVEFKNGSNEIAKLPQFLSLPANDRLFPMSFAEFYYLHWIDKYIACDTGITTPKPSLSEYMSVIYKNNYNIHPFILQLKEREHTMKLAKNAVVNNAIHEFCIKYGQQIDLIAFHNKVSETQNDKTYVLWIDGAFHTEQMCNNGPMTFMGVRNRNVIEVQDTKTKYSLLLRWKNHKGVLFPAFQISATPISHFKRRPRRV